MSYYLISDFRRGVDTRRIAESADTGTLRWLSGGFVNSGGEIEKLRGFIMDDQLTAALKDASGRGGWCGPVRTSDGRFLFAGPASQPQDFPSSVAGVPLWWSELNGAAQALSGLSDADVFGANVYLSARFNMLAEGAYSEHFFGQPGEILNRVEKDAAPLQDEHVLTLASKVFRGQGSTLGFSAVADPSDTAGTGSGELDVTTSEGAVGPIQGLGVYLGQLAVFGQNGVQIWDVDPDPDATQFVQSIGGINVVSGRTILTYDNGDVLYLTPNGIRSLRARDQTAFARGDDIGSPVDEMVRAVLQTGTPRGLIGPNGVMSETQTIPRPRPGEMVSLTEPTTGQLWVVVGGSIFVFSRFASSGVQAWSLGELPTSALGGGAGYVRGAATASNRLLICTSEGEAYVYGGEDGESYDTQPCVVETPFMAMGSPATFKSFSGIDVLGRGRWEVEAAFDPAQPDLYEHIGTVEGTTTTLQSIPMTGRSTHIALRFSTTDNRVIPKLGQAAIHFREGRAS